MLELIWSDEISELYVAEADTNTHRVLVIVISVGLSFSGSGMTLICPHSAQLLLIKTQLSFPL